MLHFEIPAAKWAKQASHPITSKAACSTEASCIGLQDHVVFAGLQVNTSEVHMLHHFLSVTTTIILPPTAHPPLFCIENEQEATDT